MIINEFVCVWDRRDRCRQRHAATVSSAGIQNTQPMLAHARLCKGPADDATGRINDKTNESELGCISKLMPVNFSPFHYAKPVHKKRLATKRNNEMQWAWPLLLICVRAATVVHCRRRCGRLIVVSSRRDGIRALAHVRTIVSRCDF